VDGAEYKFWYTEGVTAGTVLKLLNDCNTSNEHKALAQQCNYKIESNILHNHPQYTTHYHNTPPHHTINPTLEASLEDNLRLCILMEMALNSDNKVLHKHHKTPPMHPTNNCKETT
jgi:hypothetical protein